VTRWRVPGGHAGYHPSMRPIAVLPVVAGLTALAGCGTAVEPATPALPPSTIATSPAPARSGPAPTSAAAPGPSISGLDAPVLLGTHRTMIKPAEAGTSVLAVDGSGRLDVTDAQTDRALFVLLPTAGRYMIKMAADGQACLALRTGGGGPSTVNATACDPGSAGQLFSIAPPDSGDPATYVISVSGAYLQVSGPDGLIAQRPGNSAPITAFVLADKGPAA